MIDNERRPAQIAIDVHMLGERETGNETYIRGLLRGLRAVENPHHYALYTPHPATVPTDLADPQFRPRQITPANNLLRVGYAMPRAVRADHVDLLHVTYTLPPLLPRSCRRVVTVHDISYHFFPEAFSPRDRLLLSLAVPLSLRRADHVLTISQHSRRDIIDQYHVAPSKITAIPLAAEAHFQPVRAADELAAVRARYRLPERFILAVGNLQPRKNLARLVEAYAELVSRRQPPERLVLVGKPLWQQSALAARIKALGLDELVQATGYVPDDDLPAIYSAATVFVYPSLYEGFGLPPLEAMACGTPVITSTTSALPETVGDAALTIEPRNTGALAQALERLLDDDTLRQHLSAAGQRQAARFSWGETARRTLAVYNHLLGETR